LRVIAVWVPHWLRGLKGALPPDQISEQQFPKVFAWIERFNKLILAAISKSGKAPKINGPEAVKQVSASEFAEEEGSVDENDPSKLRKGEVVEVWPIDSGVSRRDRGSLVKLDGGEIVVEKENGEGKIVRVHAPRHGFRVVGVRTGGEKL